MDFYMSVELVEEKRKDGCIFEARFSKFEDEKKMEKIIADGLIVFQKRNSYIQVDDGHIEFFDDNSANLRIENSCTYPLSKRRIEDLRQELFVAFKLSDEELTRLRMSNSKKDTMKQSTKVLMEEMKEAWEQQFGEQIDELKQDIAGQKTLLQKIVRKEINQQSKETEKNYRLLQKELQETLLLENDATTGQLQEFLQKEQTSVDQMKQGLADLDSLITTQNNQLQTALTKSQQELFKKEGLTAEQLKKGMSDIDSTLATRSNQLQNALVKSQRDFFKKEEANIGQIANGLSDLKTSMITKNNQIQDVLTKAYQELVQTEESNGRQMKKSIADLGSSIVAKNEQLQTALTKSQQEHFKKEGAATSQMKKDLADLGASIVTKNEQLQAALTKSQQEHLKKEEANTEEMKEELATLNASVAEKNSQLQTVLTAALTEAQQELLNNEEANAGQMKQELSDLKASIETQNNQLQTKLTTLTKSQQALANKEEAHAGQVKKSLSDLTTSITEQDKKLQKALTKAYQELIEKEEATTGQLNERLEKLDSSIEESNDKLQVSLTNAYTVAADDNSEKIADLKDKLSSEIEESTVELKEEFNLLNTALHQKVEEEIGLINSSIQDMDVAITANNSAFDEREEATKKHLRQLTEIIAFNKSEVASLGEKIEKNEETLMDRMDTLESNFENIFNKVDSLHEAYSRSNQQQVLDRMNEIKGNLNKKLEAEGQKIILEEQLSEIRELVTGTMNQIKPLFVQLQRDNQFLNNKIDALEANQKSASVHQLEVKEAAHVSLLEETAAPEKKDLLVEERKDMSKGSPSKSDDMRNAPIKVLESERVIRKVEPKLAEEQEKTVEVSKAVLNKEEVDRQLSDMLKLTPEPTVVPEVKQVLTVNPFLPDLEELQEQFLEIEKEPIFDRSVRLSKTEYQESVTSVYSIENRWENAILDKGNYKLFGLETLEEHMKVLPELLADLKTLSKKETMFNQNSVKVKKSTWEKIKTYHQLSMYLDYVLNLRSGLA